MKRWYNNYRKFQEERIRVAEAYPLLRLVIAPPGFSINNVLYLEEELAIVHGSYELGSPDLCESIDYRIVVIMPVDYPKSPPLLFCDDPKLPLGIIDRHIMYNGQACLGVNAEIGMRWQAGSTIVDFLRQLVQPFLVWQAYYESFGKAPPWGEREHFEAGIISFYKEILKIEDDRHIRAFMTLLGRKNQPKGHEPCPCNSGKKLRDCHRATIGEARKILKVRDVQRDIISLKNFLKTNS